MPRIDEMPEYRAKLGKSTHDLSHKFGFTATVAHLLPVFHDILNPGETVELGFQYNLRTQPLQSAAMVDINSHVEYFFVPLTLLYQPFTSMFYNINDQFSSTIPSNDIPKDFPVILMDPRDTPDGKSFHEVMQSLDSDVVGFEEWFNHCYRMFDHFGWNNMDMNEAGGSSTNWHNPNVFPWQWLAYHCIYQYYYRLDTRELFDHSTFNWDRYYNIPVVDSGSIDFKKLFRIHYRPVDNDYFTDVKVSPIVDILNLNYGELGVVNDWLTRSSIGLNAVVGSGSEGTVGDNYGSVSPFGAPSTDPFQKVQTQFGMRQNNVDNYYGTFASNGLDIGTANIRAMFAAEKLWSITGRAKKNYDDQTLAHFGFKVPHDVKHEISCFGHDRGQIHIGEVISTSNVAVDSSGAITGSGGLGEIAGKGYGNLNAKPHKFTAPCHGVVMAILSFTPVITYGYGYLKCNAVTSPNDLFKPEYDHLGMQPLFGYEGHPEEYADWSNIIGWQYRYEQWKRRYHRVSAAFRGTGSLDSWMLDFGAPTSVNVADTNNYMQYLYAPQSLNQIMLVNYVDVSTFPNESTMYDGDPFVVDGYIHCKKVSTMSDYSLPRLDA